MSRRLVFWTVAVLAVLAAAAQAWVLRWTCDDAFISFRYAQNFAEGHGLVFNLDPSEAPVEGYTNFTWTLWLALAVKLGWSDAALENWSIVWGVAAHAATVLLLASLAWRASGARAFVPIAACGYAAIHHAASLAPAGLETALFVLLVTAMLRPCLRPIDARVAWWLGALGVFTAMTRPDGAIPCAIAGLFVLRDARLQRAPRVFVGYVLPFLLVFAPYLLWRHAYYGYWLPNTFYAKSGSDPCLAMGWAYVRGFLFCYWPLLLPFAPLAWFALRRAGGATDENVLHGRRPWLAIGAFVGSYLAFVVWVGGDFMFGRFLLPILPTLLLALDLACVRWPAAWLQPVLAAIVVVGCAFRVEPTGLDNPFNDVSDNRAISFLRPIPNGPTLAELFREAGDYLRPLFAGLDVRIAIAGGHANAAYRSRAPVAIECAAGLTDAHIARLPTPNVGKRGHDKPRDRAYLERRRVHFMLETNFEGDYGKVDTWRDIDFPTPPFGFPMRLVTWDRDLMRELRRREPGIQVQDFEAFLDAYIAEMPKKTKEQVRADYAKFQPFYFARNDDPQRRAAFEAFLK
jgi:hypothetical protein